MAKVIGTSGAWQRLVDDLSIYGLTVERPEDLDSLLASIEALNHDEEVAHRENTACQTAERRGRIATLAAERGLFKRIINHFRKAALRSEIRSLEAVDATFAERLAKRTGFVRSLATSRALGGAKAELTAIEQLSLLPDTCTVYNDVHLCAGQYMSYNGEALRSAQLDHVVLTPAGVFVVETKHWSRQFVGQGAFHDPFDQISRASHLCRTLLGEFGSPPVRSVIAYMGSLPPQHRHSRVQTIGVECLAEYVAGFRQQSLPEVRMANLRRFFHQHVRVT